MLIGIGFVNFLTILFIRIEVETALYVRSPTAQTTHLPCPYKIIVSDKAKPFCYVKMFCSLEIFKLHLLLFFTELEPGFCKVSPVDSIE